MKYKHSWVIKSNILYKTKKILFLYLLAYIFIHMKGFLNMIKTGFKRLIYFFLNLLLHDLPWQNVTNIKAVKIRLNIWKYTKRDFSLVLLICYN